MERTPLLELRRVGRRVNSEFSLREISLAVYPGEIHAILGRNAAGKSALFSAIMGAVPLQAGQILWEGKPVSFSSPTQAVQAGLMLVGQNMGMFPALSVSSNLYFGMEPKVWKLPIMDTGRMRRQTRELLGSMGLQLNPNTPLGELSPARQQLVGIARAVVSNARMVLLDEPTSRLDAGEKQEFYRALEGLRRQGRGFLIITHDLEEARRLADRITVLERGRVRYSGPAQGLDLAGLRQLAYGQEADAPYRRPRFSPGPELLKLEGFGGSGFAGVDLTLCAGELVGLVGGSDGSTLGLIRALGGLSSSQGLVRIDGQPLKLDSPLAALEAGIQIATSQEDEQVLQQAAQLLQSGSGAGMAARARLGAKTFSQDLGRSLRAFVLNPPQEEYTTGGNRRRELMERALERFGRIYLLCDPSAGLDLPGRRGLYQLVGQRLEEGGAVLWATSDLEEAAGLCDRVVVLRQGQLTQVLSGEQLTPQNLRQALAD